MRLVTSHTTRTAHGKSPFAPSSPATAAICSYTCCFRVYGLGVQTCMLSMCSHSSSARTRWCNHHHHPAHLVLHSRRHDADRVAHAHHDLGRAGKPLGRRRALQQALQLACVTHGEADALLARAPKISLLVVNRNACARASDTEVIKPARVPAAGCSGKRRRTPR